MDSYFPNKNLDKAELTSRKNTGLRFRSPGSKIWHLDYWLVYLSRPKFSHYLWENARVEQHHSDAAFLYCENKVLMQTRYGNLK